MTISQLDHLVQDVEATCAFYERVLGMAVVTFGNQRKAVKFGSQKINLHQAGREGQTRAARPTPGLGDLCFITPTPFDERVVLFPRSRFELDRSLEFALNFL